MAVKKVYVDFRFTKDDGTLVTQQVSHSVETDSDARELFDAVVAAAFRPTVGNKELEGRIHFQSVNPNLVPEIVPETAPVAVVNPAVPQVDEPSPQIPMPLE
jgi:hypothetical protein